MNKLTKIVTTIGPSSRNYDTIKKFIENGVDVFRLNFSHGDHSDHLQSVNYIRQASKDTGRPVAIFQDLQGPKIRIGQITNDSIEICEGENVILTTELITGGLIDNIKKVSVDYNNLHEEISAGGRILIDDGLLELKVENVNGKEITTKVVTGGTLKPRKGVNIPHVKLKISSITEKDMADLAFAFEHQLDYVALSFVRDAEDVNDLVNIMLTRYGKRIPIIAKIEKPEAFQDIDNIVKTADAVMVARGDLGVEASLQEVPIIQKVIIRKCNLAGKPVITATQMLDSMIHNPTPTRAETTDVANAIFDGTDAVMLSGETASGKYPVESVKMMRDIAIQVETSPVFCRNTSMKNFSDEEITNIINKNPQEAVSFAAIELSEKVGANYIAAFTHSGGTAKKLSKYRPHRNIIALTPIKSTLTRLCLIWGVTPVEIGMVATVDELLDGASEILKFKNIVKDGDFIVITAGIPVGIAGSTNMIKIVKV